MKAPALVAVLLLAVFSFAAEADSTSNIHYCIAPLSYLAEGAAFSVIGNLAAWGVMVMASEDETQTGGSNLPGREIYLYPIIYPVVGALSLHLTGLIIHRRGSFLGALGGGCLGVAGVIALGKYGLDWDEDTAAQNFVIAMATVPPLLSVVGYHLFAAHIDREKAVGLGFREEPILQVRRRPQVPQITLELLKIDL